MTVKELYNRLQNDENVFGDLQLIDVRSIQEHLAGHLGGWHHPVSEFPAVLSTFESFHNVHFVVYCQKGTRSANIVKIMNAAGFNASNLEGGIEAWKREIGTVFTEL